MIAQQVLLIIAQVIQIARRPIVIATVLVMPAMASITMISMAMVLPMALITVRLKLTRGKKIVIATALAMHVMATMKTMMMMVSPMIEITAPPRLILLKPILI